MPQKGPIDVVRQGFLRLPPSTRRRVLRTLGRRAPWEAGFDHHAPAPPAGFVTGPPDFVGVGVQKAGTTWWYSLVVLHPEAYGHPQFHKERHFFDRFWSGTFSRPDVDEYCRWFPRPPGRITGEWTPDYMHQHWTAPLIGSAAPDAKLLVMLRDPVERYLSGLTHYPEAGARVTPTMACDALARGFYWRQLSSLGRSFGPHQVLVLQYEACVDDPVTNLRATYSFLGLDPSYLPPDLRAAVNETRAARPDLGRRDRELLIETYRDDVEQLAAGYPGVDLDRWPNFRGDSRGSGGR